MAEQDKVIVLLKTQMEDKNVRLNDNQLRELELLEELDVLKHIAAEVGEEM